MNSRINKSSKMSWIRNKRRKNRIQDNSEVNFTREVNTHLEV